MGRQERQIVEQARKQVEARRQRRRGEQCLRWAVAWWLVVLVLFFLLPLPGGREVGLAERVWAAAHGVCAQKEGHMLFLGGHVLPLCARDSGIYLGALLAVLYLLAIGRGWAGGRPPRWFWRVVWGSIGFFAVDVANSVADDWFFGGVYRPHNLLRLTSGLLMGLVTGVLLLWALHLSFARRRPERPIVDRPAGFLGLLLVEALGGLALWSGWGWLYLPMTVLTLGGMVGMLLVGVWLLFLFWTRGREPVPGFREAAPAFFWAGVTTVALIASLSWLRYRLGL